MLESLFIMLFVIGTILTILGALRWEEEGDLFFWGFSLIIFITLMAQAIYIEVPYIAVTDSTTYVTGNQQHMEMGISALCLGFVIFDIIAIILIVTAWRDSKKGIAMP